MGTSVDPRGSRAFLIVSASAGRDVMQYIRVVGHIFAPADIKVASMPILVEGSKFYGARV